MKPRKGYRDASNRVLRGIGASPGICVGTIHRMDSGPTRIPHQRLEASQVGPEIAQFRRAVAASIEQIQSLQRKLRHRRGREARAILEAHRTILRDEALLKGTERIILRQRIGAEWALQKNLAEIRTVFDRLTDSYIRERWSDIEFVSQRILRNLSGQRDLADAPWKPHPVVVAHRISPADAVNLGRLGIEGLVSEAGGKECHTAIVARALEIPAVVGVRGLLDEVVSEQVVIVDGTRGEVVLDPTSERIEEAVSRSQGQRRRLDELAAEPARPARTRDGRRLRLFANLEMIEEARAAVRYGAEGVGLFRTEFLAMRRRVLSEETQFRWYRRLLRSMEGRPVTIRTWDLGGEKRIPGLGMEPEPEDNPALGLRSIRLSLTRLRPLFLAQLRAILRASAEGKLRLLFPMVGCVEELQDVLEAVAEAKALLRQRGQAYDPRVALGIMIEVPAAALLSEVLARHVDFFSIGTNDLIQFTLATDRHNEQVAYLYDPLQPAVLRLLHRTVRAAHRARIPVGLCGEMAGEALHLPVLLGMGFDEISANPQALPLLRHLVRHTSYAETRALARRVLAMEDVRAIRSLVRDWMLERFPDTFEF